MRLLKFALTRLRSERGQALVLAALVMVILMGFAAMAIDVGYWFSQKRELQKAVDAAALAGAQELPNGASAAEAEAREYLAKNGVTDEDTISITYRCTSTYQMNCNPSIGKWDTMVIEVDRSADAWFARLFDINEVTMDVRAAGCVGSCGGSPFTPVDVVQILDRTTSMDDGEMARAKEGARALLEYFNDDIQRVGLGVLPPGLSWANPCPASIDYTVWLPVSLSEGDDFENPDGTLDESSRLVSTIDCLTTAPWTNIGSPMKAATDELVANGRQDVKWGIILLTDGAANRMPSEDTGFRSPTANAAVTSDSGDNNGFESNPTNAYADDTSYAVDTNSGTSTSTSCGSTAKDRHDFYNYGISIPSGHYILGIEVRLIARVDSTFSTTRRMCVELSWDGGVTWTPAQQTWNLSSSYQTYNLGGEDATWDHNWTPSQLSDANFRVRITNVASSTSRDFYLDWVAVRVLHSPSDGPCQYAADQADIAKAAGIEIFTIGYGVGESGGMGGEVCGSDHGAWQGVAAADLLLYMATDSDHFFNEPSTADLRPIFEVIGSQLSGGSRLVE